MSSPAGSPASEPLVLTLALDPDDAERFDALRREHFPADRNHLAAHVTLFHALPGDEQAAVLEEVGHVARRPPFRVRVSGVRQLGHGVAYALESPDLAAVHRELLAALSASLGSRLTGQDRQKLSPHVTVQNKVSAEAASELHEHLSASFSPWEVRATGLALWRYLGGPWEPVEVVAFSGP
jgi:2'-5' RNA ligase